MATSTCPLANSQYYLMLADESTWGTVGTTWYHLPVNKYGVKFRPSSRQARPKAGTMQGKHFSNTKGMVAGSIDTALYGFAAGASTTVSLMEKLLTWGFGDSESVCTSSKSSEWGLAGTDYGNKQHLGMRVDSVVLRGSEDQDFISMTLNVVGQNESNSTFAMEALPSDANGITEVEFTNVDFYIGANSGSLALLPIRAFVLQRNRKQQVHYLGSNRPTYIGAAVCETNLVIAPMKLDRDNDVLLRALGSQEQYGRLIIKGSHVGTLSTGDLAVAQIDMPRMSLMDKDDTDDREGFTFEQLQWSVIKPDTTDNSVVLTYSTE